ncbi:MAG: extracellular solute-binding protein [Oscillospiraceae bacterium]
MNKRLIVKTISLGISCIMLASCALGTKLPKLSADKPITLTLWHYYNGKQKTAFDEQVTEFNETVGTQKGIVIQAFGQGNIGDLTNKVMDAAQKKVGAGEIPNIFAAYTDTAFAIDKLGLAASLDEYLINLERDEYIEEYLSEGRFGADGSLKIFPIAKSVELMMINKTDWDKFAVATGADVKKLATIEGVTQTAEQYYNWTDSQTQQPNDGKAFFGRDAMANYMLIGAKQMGVDVFSVSDDKARLNTDKAVIKRLWDNYYIPFVKGYFTANNRFRTDDIKTGNIIALVGSSSGTTYFPDKVNISDTESYPIERLILEAPIFEGGEKYAVQQGAGMVVTRSTPQAEYASTIFLKWLTEEQRNIKFAVDSAYLPVKKSSCDINKITQALIETQNDTIDSFEKSLNTVNNYKLYTSKPFNGGLEARAILEKSMASAAATDRAAVLEAMASGATRDEALAKYLTESRYDDWYTEFDTALNSIAQ